MAFHHFRGKIASSERVVAGLNKYLAKGWRAEYREKLGVVLVQSEAADLQIPVRPAGAVGRWVLEIKGPVGGVREASSYKAAAAQVAKIAKLAGVAGMEEAS